MERGRSLSLNHPRLISDNYFINQKMNSLHPTRRGVSLSLSEFTTLSDIFQRLERCWGGLRETPQCYTTHSDTDSIFGCDHCHPTPKKQEEQSSALKRAVTLAPSSYRPATPCSSTTSAGSAVAKVIPLAHSTTAQPDADDLPQPSSSGSTTDIPPIRPKRKINFAKSAPKRTRSAIIESGSDTDEALTSAYCVPNIMVAHDLAW